MAFPANNRISEGERERIVGESVKRGRVHIYADRGEVRLGISRRRDDACASSVEA